MRTTIRTAGTLLTAAAIALGAALPALGQAGMSAADNPGYTADYCLTPNKEGTNFNCRLAGDGSIRVLFGSADSFDYKQADRIIVETWETLRLFGNLGLENATASSDDIIQVNILSGDDNPEYAWKTKNIYIGEVTARKIAAGSGVKALLDLRHELIHLIQGRSYFMSVGRIGDATTWWLEMTAEMLPFYTDPAGAAYDAELYGSGTLDASHANISQYAPYRWPSDSFYQHAQRLYASTCTSGCTFTLDEIIEAVNEGKYLLDDAARKQAFTDGLEAYAKYLLTGAHPDRGAVAPVADGTAMGNHVMLLGGGDDAGLGVKMRIDTYKPQIIVDEATIDAPLEADSVYVLAVASGAATQPYVGTGKAPAPGAPVMFRVAPGPELWYRVDGGPIEFHDGGADLVLGPLHSEYGIGEVRIVAIAAQQPETFYATFEPVDLEGDWVFRTSGKAKQLSLKCPKHSPVKLKALEFVSADAAQVGSYVQGLKATDLDWTQLKALPYFFEKGVKGVKPRPVKYDAELDLRDTITGSLKYDAPSPRKGDVGVDLGLKADMTFDTLTFPSAQKAKSAKKNKKAKGPVAKAVLTGTAIVETDLYVVAIENTKRTKNKVVWHRDHCISKVEVPVTGSLYADGAVKAPTFK